MNNNGHQLELGYRMAAEQLLPTLTKTLLYLEKQSLYQVRYQKHGV